MLPRDNFLNSDKKCWFHCISCNHDFDSTLSHVAAERWCPYCSNKKLCENDTCITCLEKSFSIHEKSKYWNYNINNILPRHLFINSHEKCWFKCEKDHVFDIKLDAISSGKNWCRYCMNKSKQKLQDRLKTDFPLFSENLALPGQKESAMIS